MLHQIQQAIDPHIPLAVVIANWPEVANDLAERSRHRIPQLEALAG